MPEIINASFEILEYPEHPLEMIEKVARTCYQTAEKIGPGSAERMVRMLLESGHHAMIEFGGWITVRFVSNRGFTHEQVRMRLTSDAQESTRYCNYSKDKFGQQIRCIDPASVLAMTKLSIEDQAWAKGEMLESWLRDEETYMRLVARKIPAEIARDVLPIGLKAELNVGANVREWRHIITMRTSRRAHPRMRELMRPMLSEFRRLTPILWDDVGSVNDEDVAKAFQVKA
jgi:thymidylate synthase (FAD)